MINLWFEESYWAYTNGVVSGPEKVVRNFIKSLEQENISYTINEDKYKFNFLMQYEHDIAYQKHEKLDHESCFIGPQWVIWNPLSNFLLENPQYYNKLIVPSDWVGNLIIDKCGITSDKIVSWPVGIEIPNRKKDVEIDCLIYFKNRELKSLNEIISFLKNKNIRYKVLTYGDYKNKQLVKYALKSKFGLILGSTESQGIAINELMATNLPLFVIDKNINNYENIKLHGTTVPYWSSECGEKILDLNDFKMNFQRFLKNYESNTYKPNNLINEKLSFEKFIENIQLEFLKF